MDTENLKPYSVIFDEVYSQHYLVPRKFECGGLPPMKLKKLEISGFKSFPEKAAIDFPPGISAVVGPNGCGKSNIVDALRWVMGEQSVKQLRGKNMEDVIFAGTKGKPPLNMAEVSLTLLNDNGSAPEELRNFPEINVTRRLFRSGESAYFINRQPCRLKDIHNVFMGSGMGAKTYAVIQQGNIGAITDAGPDERRLFIEEAAGVTRYKNRKKEALRKVAATHQNLLRVSDIITEVDRQMKGLKRQARKAERFKKYSDRLKTLNIQLGVHYYDDYAKKLVNTTKLLQASKDEDLQHTSQLKKIDAAVEAIKMKRWQKNQEISAQKSQSFEAQRKIDRLETENDHQRNEVERIANEVVGLEAAKNGLEEKNAGLIEEIASVEAEYQTLADQKNQVAAQIEAKQSEYQQVREELAQLNRQLESNKSSLMALVADEARYKNTYQNASQNKENLARRRNRIDQDIEAAQQEVRKAQEGVAIFEKEIGRLRENIAVLKNKLFKIEEQLNSKIAALSRQVKQTQSTEMMRNQVRSQLAALKKMAESYAWYRDGVQAIMQIQSDGAGSSEPPKSNSQAAFSKDILGLMAEVLEPEPSYETAVESVLGDALQYIVVKNQDAGIAAIDYLQTSGEGRSGFIPLPTIKPVSTQVVDDPQSSDRLLTHVSVKPGFENIAQALLGHVCVAEDMRAAQALFNRNGRIQTIVTKNGNIISHQGIFVGGSKEKLSNILTKRQELKTLESQAVRLDKKVTAEQKAQEALEKEVRGLETTLQQHIENKENLLIEERDTEKSLYQAAEERKHARRHLEILQLEREQLVGEENDIDLEISKYHQAIREIEQNVHSAQQAVTDVNTKISQITNSMEAYNQQVIDLRLKHTSVIASVDNNRNTLRRLQDFFQDGSKRLEQLAEDIRLKKEKRAALKIKIEKIGEDLTGMYAGFKLLKEALQHNESDYVTIDTELQQKDGMVSDIQKARETTLQNIRLLELEQSEQAIKQENIATRLQEKYYQRLDQLRQQVESLPENAAVLIKEMEAEVETLRSRISRIGDVNLGAIDEYDEYKTRYDFLIEQKEDLEKAIQDLHKVIKKINRITQERFMHTFNAVNEKLIEVFPKLFEGGTAKLVLTNPEDPLETGVEFMIHPPGKKLTRMSLLSGGEKAMSAIAFIFSIFLIKPTSFCLMDEIDAPLDDANVFRFNDLLQVIGKKSQIIMITHNKRSMEFADTLFGITMGEKGVSKIVSVNFDQQAN